MDDPTTIRRVNPRAQHVRSAPPQAEPYLESNPYLDDKRTKKARTRGPKHGCLSFVLWLIILVVLAVCVLRSLPLERSVGRAVPEIVSFTPWFIAPALVCLILALLWHRWILSVVSATCVAALLVWHAGYMVPARNVSAEAGAAVSGELNTQDRFMRIMTFNTYNGHASASELMDVVRDNNVELLALQEVSWSFLSELEAQGISEVFPYRVESEPGRWDNGGLNCIFARVPLDNQSSDLLPMDLSAMSAGSITIEGHTLRFVSCHPSSPHLGGQGLWQQGLSTIGSLAGYDHSYVLMGDFNSTWDHASFRALLGNSFVDAGQQAGEGFHMSYPAFDAYPQIPALIEIDHIIYAKDAGIYVGGLETKHIHGSDHYALLATLEVR